MDEKGDICTEIDLLFPNKVYIQAWIEASGEGANPADGGPISIDMQSGFEYVQMTEGTSFANGRTVIIEPVAQPPQGTANASAEFMVSAPLGGQPFSAPVSIHLVRGGFELRFSGGEAYD